MGRRARIFASGGAYHFTARAVAGEPLFVTAFDFLAMLSLLRDVRSRFDWRILAWCLMNTHYHLVVLVGRQPNVSEGMHRLNGIYARGFNERHHRRGHLFGDRYSPTQIESEQHLHAACSYVLLNPVNAGLVRSVEDWPWSGNGRLEPRGGRTP